MKYFISEAEYAMEYYQADNNRMVRLARELREEIKKENKHNNLIRTQEYLASNELFSRNYQPAIYNSSIFVKGQYNTEKAYGFLCNLKKQMNVHLPKNTN